MPDASYRKWQAVLCFSLSVLFRIEKVQKGCFAQAVSTVQKTPT
jgi:hypothetical protein